MSENETSTPEITTAAPKRRRLFSSIFFIIVLFFLGGTILAQFGVVPNPLLWVVNSNMVGDEAPSLEGDYEVIAEVRKPSDSDASVKAKELNIDKGWRVLAFFKAT